jgi:hypothetical protein
MNEVGLFIYLAGLIIGLGAVTVIDLHGFLGRKSKYWTQATIRTHKVTKPLIWLGITLAIIGGIMFYKNEPFRGIPMYHAIIAGVLILNGFFLSFVISPYLLEKEKEGKDKELLPETMQAKITISFIVSFSCWWSGVYLLAKFITEKIA